MIKIQNNTATREALPAFLLGLQLESLADLSWTDPALGVADCKWLPEVDASPALQQYERYGDETLTLDGDVVTVTRAVVPWTAQEIADDIKSRVPQVVTMRQARLALLGAGLLDAVETAITTAGPAAKIEWDYATEVQRSAGLVPQMATALGMSEAQIDALFTAAGVL